MLMKALLFLTPNVFPLNFSKHEYNSSSGGGNNGSSVMFKAAMIITNNKETINYSNFYKGFFNFFNFLSIRRESIETE